MTGVLIRMPKGMHERPLLIDYLNYVVNNSVYSAAEAEALFEPLAEAWHDSVLGAGFQHVGGGTASAWTDLENAQKVGGAVPSASTDPYQRTYRLNDSLSGPAPIFIRGVPFSYKNVSYTAAKQGGIAVYPGTAVLSATTELVDKHTPYYTSGIYSAAAGYSFPDHRYVYTGGDGYAGVVLPKIDATRPALGKGAFILERTTDALGNPTDAGFAILRLGRDVTTASYSTQVDSSYCYPDMAAYSYATKAWTIMNRQYLFAPLTASHRSGDFLNAYGLHYEVDGVLYRMRSFVAVHDSEMAFGQPFELDTTGVAPYTFMPTGNLLYTPHYVSAAIGLTGFSLAMRWE